jgi:transposase
MEISTEGEQRRHWRLEDKLRIVAEAERPGAVLSAVARQHAISRNLLRRWRDQARRGVLTAQPAVFVPVQVASQPPGLGVAISLAEPHGDAAAASGRIEVVLADGTLIRAEAGVSVAALRRVVAMLRA